MENTPPEKIAFPVNFEREGFQSILGSIVEKNVTCLAKKGRFPITLSEEEFWGFVENITHVIMEAALSPPIQKPSSRRRSRRPPGAPGGTPKPDGPAAIINFSERLKTI